MKIYYAIPYLFLGNLIWAQQVQKDTVKSTEIKEVVLKKKTLQKKSDRMVYDVGNSPVAKGNNGFELLKQTPMLSSTDDKSLKVLGKGSTKIYINGKAQTMDADAIVDMLKSMPAENISKIEVITVPSSEFQVEGNEAIVNVILKKKSSDGINGNVKIEDQIAKSNSATLSTSFNYRKGKFGLQANVNGGKIVRDQYYILTNGNDGGAQPFSLKSEGDVVSKFGQWGGYLNMDYQLTDRQKLDFSFQHRDKEEKPSTTNFINELRNSGSLFEITQTLNTTNSKVSNQSYNLGYEWLTDDKGSKLNANASYMYFDKTGVNNNSTVLLNTQQQPVSILKQFNQSTPLRINNWALKADYVQQLKSGHVLSAGLAYNNTLTDSDTRFENILPPTGLDGNQSNHFAYEEKIYGIYGTWEKKWSDRTNTKLGLRYERTNAEGNVLDKNIQIERKDGDWLPFASFNYNMNEDHQFSTSFSSRVRRPSFWALNPVKIYLTANNYIQNNPFTQSELVYNTELQYIFKSSYFITASYGFTDRALEQVPLSGMKNDGSGESVLAYISTNYGTKKEFSLSFGMQKQYFKGIWQMNNSLVLGYNQYKGTVYGDPTDTQNLVAFQKYELDRQSQFVQLQLNNTIRLSPQKDWYLGVNYFYLSPIELVVGKMNTLHSLDLSLKKMHKNWTFSLEAKDVFGTNKNYIKGSDGFGNYNIVDQNQYNRKLVLGLTYNFGNQKVQKVKKSESANDDVRSRTGS